MSLSLAIIVVLIFVAIPAYISLFWLNRRKIKFSSGVLIFISREMLVLFVVGALVPYFSVFELLPRFMCGAWQVHWATPIRLAVATAIANPVLHDRIGIWLAYIFAYYLVCFGWGALWTGLLRPKLTESADSWVKDTLESLGLWDITSQMLAFGRNGDESVWVYLSQKDDGTILFYGRLAGFVEQGALPGIVLENVYIRRLNLATGRRKLAYQKQGFGTLERMFFAKDKIFNIYFKRTEKLASAETPKIKKLLQKAKEELDQSMGV